MAAVVLHWDICILVYFTLTHTRFSAKIDLEMTYRQSYRHHTSVSLTALMSVSAKYDRHDENTQQGEDQIFT